MRTATNRPTKRPPVLYVYTSAANKAFLIKQGKKLDKEGRRVGLSKVVNDFVTKMRASKR